MVARRRMDLKKYLGVADGPPPVEVNGNGKNKGGRPSKYQAEFAVQATKLCVLGATDFDLANFFNVSPPTIWAWTCRYPEFHEAVKNGKDAFDARIVRSLAQRATGYDFDTIEYKVVDKELVPVNVKKHMPGDVVAQIFWLKNRKPGEWRDKQHVDHDVSGRIDLELTAERTINQRLEDMSQRLITYDKKSEQSK